MRQSKNHNCIKRWTTLWAFYDGIESRKKALLNCIIKMLCDILGCNQGAKIFHSPIKKGKESMAKYKPYNYAQEMLIPVSLNEQTYARDPGIRDPHACG